MSQMLRQPHPDSLGRPTSPPVMLVHGWGATTGAWRTGQQNLRASGFASATWAFQPFGTSIQKLALRLTDDIKRYSEKADAPVQVVAWSLGGCIATLAALDAADSGSDHISGVVTLATPHSGSRTANLARALRAPVGVGRQLCSDTALMDELTHRSSELEPGSLIRTLGADQDLVVPDQEASLHDDFHTTILGLGHHSILEAERTWQAVAADLEALCASAA